MYPDRTKFSDYIFDNNDRLYINLENSNNTINPNVTIKQFLTNNDYTIYDYGKGIALDKYNRKIRIGKILRKLNFEEQLTKLFTNDKSRNNVNNINLKMCITRNPYDVAAMSVNRGWNSCMNMSGGSQARKIEDAIRVGTHVAYLIHNTDDNILRPIARILLNPYHSENNHTILFPEKLYGTGNNTFIESTYNWCKSMFPLKDTYYKKIIIYTMIIIKFLL
jgi:hypothetical protein